MSEGVFCGSFDGDQADFVAVLDRVERGGYEEREDEGDCCEQREREEYDGLPVGGICPPSNPIGYGNAVMMS